ncbi:cytochrome c oxidaseI [Mesobacillus boroniphilus JCM 21738]|uniref:Cytochrome c oxidaseI n=1 Tax=Mesobacillus boroniphilus JCM 21738 TaxID=1294265 RepID=W4RJ07_9BACI|nr:cytochrome c oxidaseI [Mesobacillus boroniphilus JCM 21738]
MHIHKFEKIWLIFGITTLIVFLSVIGVSAFYLGNQLQAVSQQSILKK